MELSFFYFGHLIIQLTNITALAVSVKYIRNIIQITPINA